MNIANSYIVRIYRYPARRDETSHAEDISGIVERTIDGDSQVFHSGQELLELLGINKEYFQFRTGDKPIGD